MDFSRSTLPVMARGICGIVLPVDLCPCLPRPSTARNRDPSAKLPLSAKLRNATFSLIGFQLSAHPRNRTGRRARPYQLSHSLHLQALHTPLPKSVRGVVALPNSYLHRRAAASSLQDSLSRNRNSTAFHPFGVCCTTLAAR
jgi:hypothetical protein